MASNVIDITAGIEPAARIEGDTLVLDGFTRARRAGRPARRCCRRPGRHRPRHPRRRHAGTRGGPGDDRRRGRREGVRRHDVDLLAGLDSFTNELDTKTRELLDGEEGALPRSFEEFKVELEQLLDGTFDPDSKRSALAKLEEVMRRVAADQVKAVRGLIDPDNEESPLGRYRTEIVKSVRDETAKVHKAVQELATTLAVDEVRAEMFELTTKKGFTYEDELEHALIGICRPHGDVADRVGGTPGQRGRKGDFTVTLDPADAAGQDVRYVLEAKNQQLNLRDALKEADAAIANREALAGIVVFAKADQCPGDAAVPALRQPGARRARPERRRRRRAAARLLLGPLGRPSESGGLRRHASTSTASAR